MSEQTPTTNFEELKQTIAKNLVKFRKQSNLTQQELAEKINYSDKAVSKWERGEGIPDVLVLKALADIYGITVNDFLTEGASVPLVKPRRKNLIAKRWLVALLSAGLVWLIATVVTVVWLLVDNTVPVAKYAYLVALPVTFIVLLVFSCLWCKQIWVTYGVVSALIWSLCVLLDVALHVIPNSWLIYLIGAAMQALVILWSLLRLFVIKDKANKDK
ncbi:MAG: helix-turn-helix domain-containing protein [Candidatus Fimimonas sp.]